MSPACVNAWHVRRAARVLGGGGIIIYPSEGVLGLGCDPFRASAVRRLLRLKRRPMRSGFILIASAFEQIRPLLAALPPSLMQEVGNSWPGPVTWVLPAAERVPDWVTGGPGDPCRASHRASAGQRHLLRVRRSGGLHQRQHSWKSSPAALAFAISGTAFRCRLRGAGPNRWSAGTDRDPRRPQRRPSARPREVDRGSRQGGTARRSEGT